MRPTKELFNRYARDNWRLYLAEVDGVMWASNTYWAIPVPDDKHPIARLLAAYNLPLKTSWLDVDDTITVAEADPGKTLAMAKIVQTVPDDLGPMTPFTLNDEPLYGYDAANKTRTALYNLAGGRFIALNDKYRQVVENHSPGSEWFGGPDPLKPVYRRLDGEITGVLMGVRCKATGTAL